MRRLLARLRGWLAPVADRPLLFGALAIVLCSPAINCGLALDDVFHRHYLLGRPALDGRPIETAGMFQRLVKHKYWKSANCILVSMGGVPTRACRRFIRRLADTKKIPVYVFVDGDPYGISNIYRTLKVGSGNAAHLNEYFCVPQARYLGITPKDIVDYKLPTHPLKEVDIKRARDAIKNDPFFRHHKEWVQAVEQLLKMGVRAEQQALAKWGLNYVIDRYLPEKLGHPERFLP